MNISNDIESSSNNNMKASFSLSSVELGFSILAGVATALALGGYIYSILPHTCGPDIDYSYIGCDYTWTRDLAWELIGRTLFLTYVIPFVLANAISGIFLLRSIRRDVRQFSMIANLAFSFPALAFIVLPFLGNLSCGFSVLGVVIAIVASARSQGRGWDWIALPFNLAWIVLFVLFGLQQLGLYGD